MLSLSWIAWLSVILIQAIAYFGFLGRKGPRGSSSPSSSSSLSNDCHENSASKGTESESSSKEKGLEDLQKSEDKLANPQVISGKSASSSKIPVAHCPDTETIKDKEESCDIDENNLEKERKILSYGTFDTWDTTTSSCQDFVELTAATRRTTVDGPSFPHDASSFQVDHHHHAHVHLHNPDTDTDTDNSCCIDNECESIDNECDSIDDEEWRLQLLKDYYYNDDEAGGTTGDFYNYKNNMMEISVGETPVDSPVPGDSTLQNRISSSETRHSALHANAIQASISVQ